MHQSKQEVSSDQHPNVAAAAQASSDSESSSFAADMDFDVDDDDEDLEAVSGGFGGGATVNESGSGSSTGQFGVSYPAGSESHVEMLDPSRLLQHMAEMTDSVGQVINLNPTYLRLLLSHFKWDKNALLEHYFSQSDPQQTFAEAGLKIPSDACLKSNQRLGTPSSGPKMCSICLQDKPYIELRSLQCRHLACLDCWTGYFKAKIDDDSDADRITCPTLNCDLLVDDSIIHSTLSPNSPTLRRFNKLISNSFVSANPCLTWCPGADCGWAANSTLGLRSMVKVECPHCNESFCCGCGWSWHDPVKCDRLLAWATKESLDSGTYSWIMSHTKDCPKCHFSIEKNGGCNHMTCKNPSCKYEFCWLCLGAWAPHGSNWNKCNRFEQEAGQKARQAQAESRVSYERYLFYFNRYINHKQSLGFEAQLTARVSDKVAVMQSCNLGTSWMEVKFLNNVVHILCSCRRTLMYTYVFAYYLRPNNQSTIFESNQYDLEQAAEQLSELLERDWAHLGLNDLKQPLQDKARYCDRRRQVLLDHVHEGYANDWWDCVTDDDLS